jgi:hypothetical protein
MFYCTSPNDDQPGKRLMLIQPFEASNGFGKLFATIVREAIPERISSDDLSTVIYGDGKNAKGWRNCSWSSIKPNAIFTEHFEVSCQLTLDDEPLLYSYGNQYYFDTYSGKIDQRMCQLMNKTFDKVKTGELKLENSEGYSISSGDYTSYCIRIAKVLGIDTFLIPINPHSRSSRSLADMDNYIIVKNPVELRDEVNKMIRGYKPATI